jgi:hypothetical protein
MGHNASTPTNHENTAGVWVTVTKPVSPTGYGYV